MILLRFFSHFRLVVLATLLVMILMRLVWMDLRDYEPFYDRQVHELLISSHKPNEYLCKGDDSRASPSSRSIPSIETFPTWSTSWLYRSFFQFSCRQGLFSLDSYIRMNQGVLVITVLACVFLARIYSGSWLVCLSVAAILLSRGRLITLNGIVSGQALMTMMISLWLLSLFHWIKSGATSMLIGSWIIFGSMLTLESSVWPIAFAPALWLTSCYLCQGLLIKPLLEEIRQTQARDRWYAQIIFPYSDPSMPDENKLFQGLKRVVGWVRPSEWAYRPLVQKFQTGHLLRPLQIPFLLWVYQGKRWFSLGLATWIPGIICSMATLIYLSWTSPDSPSFLPPNRLWFQLLWQQIDLDLYFGLLVLALVLSRGPTDGLRSFWESTLLLFFILIFGILGIWLWDGLSFSTLGWDLRWQNDWRPSEYMQWFDPVLLTFTIVGVYHLIRIVDRRFFHPS